MTLSTEKKNPSKRDQALNDATSGQFGEPLIFQKVIPKFRKMKTNEKRLHENCQKISSSNLMHVSVIRR